MNWKEKLEKMIANGEAWLDLNWNDDEWNRWNDGNLTASQAELVDACYDLNIEPKPGDLSPDTISFS